MASLAEAVEDCDSNLRNSLVNWHDRRADFAQDALDQRHRVSGWHIGDARQADRRLEYCDCGGVWPTRLRQSSGQAGGVLLHDNDADDRRGVKEYYRSPERSSKNALSAACPPGRFMAWNCAWMACSRSISGGALMAAYSRSTASRMVSVRFLQ